MRILLLALLIAVPAAAKPPAAIFTDPPHDTKHPARMEVLHIPSGGVAINGVAYLAAGAGRHPTMVLCHGWPGNEKNLDLAQAVRRAGWNVITFNYRGSWGSPGAFRFAQVPEDAAAVIAYVRRPDIAAKLGIDPARIVLGGHSMGGWATAMAAAKDSALKGAIMISMANMGAVGSIPRADLVALSADSAETLADTSPEQMADELATNSAAFSALAGAPGLARLPLLVLTSDDGLAPQAGALVDAVRTAGGKRVSTGHAATDHSWSDSRIELERRVIEWLQGLK
jgi:pimeloyl-ACP methyl ester carboxylesterase